MIDARVADAFPARHLRRGMPSAAQRCLLVVVLLSFAPFACAQVIDIAWDSDGKFRREMRAEPGKFVELCGKLSPGTKVQWRFESDAATNFNVHYHEGKDVRFPVKEDGVRSSKGTLDVRSEHDYCWMWSNKGSAPTAIAVEMAKGP